MDEGSGEDVDSQHFPLVRKTQGRTIIRPKEIISFGWDKSCIKDWHGIFETYRG